MKHLTIMAASVALLGMPSIANAGWGHNNAPSPATTYNYENCMPKVQSCVAPRPAFVPQPCQPKVQKCKPDIFIHCNDPVFPYEHGGDWNGCGQQPPAAPAPARVPTFVPQPTSCCAPTPRPQPTFIPAPPPRPHPTVVNACGIAAPMPSGTYYYCGSNKRYDAYGRRIR